MKATALFLSGVRAQLSSGSRSPHEHSPTLRCPCIQNTWRGCKQLRSAVCFSPDPKNAIVVLSCAIITVCVFCAIHEVLLQCLTYLVQMIRGPRVDLQYTVTQRLRNSDTTTRSHPNSSHTDPFVRPPRRHFSQ